jgi:hypothetical protein
VILNVYVISLTSTTGGKNYVNFSVILAKWRGNLFL